MGNRSLYPDPGSLADLSSHAASNHPGRSDECSHPLLPRQCQASRLSGELATFHCLTGPNRVRLRCGLRVRPGKASPEGLLPLALTGLLVERVIYKVNSFQFTRSTRLVLALQRKANCAYLCATPLAERRYETCRLVITQTRKARMSRVKNEVVCLFLFEQAPQASTC